MTRVVVGALAVAALAAPVAAAQHRAARAHARLAVAKRSPLVVRGLDFKPLEHVTVIASAKTRVVKHVRSTLSGSFTKDMGPVVADRCSSLVISAVGNRGSNVLLRLQRPACIPVRSP